MIDPAEEARAAAWERLTQGEREAAIAKARAETLCYGFCQACGFRIEALGKNWPTHCPRCKHGSEL